LIQYYLSTFSANSTVVEMVDSIHINIILTYKHIVFDSYSIL